MFGASVCFQPFDELFGFLSLGNPFRPYAIKDLLNLVFAHARLKLRHRYLSLFCGLGHFDCSLHGLLLLMA